MNDCAPMNKQVIITVKTFEALKASNVLNPVFINLCEVNKDFDIFGERFRAGDMVLAHTTGRKKLIVLEREVL